MKSLTLTDKIQAAKDYLSGRKSIKEICNDLGIRYNSNKGNIIRIWARNYEELGEISFYDKPHRITIVLSVS